MFSIHTAEKFLESVEGNQNYPLLLLTLLDKEDVDQAIRVSAAITFKNYVKRNWRVVCTEIVMQLIFLTDFIDIRYACIHYTANELYIIYTIKWIWYKF